MTDLSPSARRRAHAPTMRAQTRLRLFSGAMVLPAMAVIVGLVAYPIVFSVWIAFTDRVIGGGGNWVGFENFARLARSPVFWATIRNTLVIVLATGVLKLALGLGLALLVTRRIPGRGFFRAMLMLPWAMPAFVAFLTWRVIYQPVGGGLNLILTQTGIYPYIVDWLGSRDTAMPSVILASVWRGFPFWFISILAALQQVPRDLYEAARVDGAGPWKQFWIVTVPGIRHVVIVTALLSTIWTANAFEHVWLLTQGGPSDATMVFPVLAYLGMQSQRIGEAAAVSVSMLPALLLLVFVATRLLRQRSDG